MPIHISYSYSWELCYSIGTLASSPVLLILLCPLVHSPSISLHPSLILFVILLIGNFSVFCSSKQIGPGLKVVSCICLPIILFLWLLIAIASSIVGGAAYGFLSPMLATFRAIDLGKANKLYHCIYVCF